MIKTACLFSVFFIVISAFCSHEKQLMDVKPLEKTICYPQEDSRFQKRLTENAKWTISHFDRKRMEYFKILIDHYRISNPIAVLEWGGGLSKTYTICIISDQTYSLGTWNRIAERFGKITISKEQTQTCKEMVQKLRNYKGEPLNIVMESEFYGLFMTFYEDNQPVYTFCLEFPLLEKRENPHTEEFKVLKKLLENILASKKLAMPDF